MGNCFLDCFSTIGVCCTSCCSAIGSCCTNCCRIIGSCCTSRCSTIGNCCTCCCPDTGEPQSRPSVDTGAELATLSPRRSNENSGGNVVVSPAHSGKSDYYSTPTSADMPSVARRSNISRTAPTRWGVACIITPGGYDKLGGKCWCELQVRTQMYQG